MGKETCLPALRLNIGPIFFRIHKKDLWPALTEARMTSLNKGSTFSATMQSIYPMHFAQNRILPCDITHLYPNPGQKNLSAPTRICILPSPTKLPMHRSGTYHWSFKKPLDRTSVDEVLSWDCILRCPALTQACVGVGLGHNYQQCLRPRRACLSMNKPGLLVHFSEQHRLHNAPRSIRIRLETEAILLVNHFHQRLVCNLLGVEPSPRLRRVNICLVPLEPSTISTSSMVIAESSICLGAIVGNFF